jgi:hypothetical protein
MSSSSASLVHPIERMLSDSAAATTVEDDSSLAPVLVCEDVGDDESAAVDGASKKVSEVAMSPAHVRRVFAAMRGLHEKGALRTDSRLDIDGEVVVGDFLLQHWQERNSRTK